MRSALLLCVLAGWSCTTPPPARPVGNARIALTVIDGGEPSDAGIVRFIALGDTGKGNPGQYQVGAAMGTHCATFGCDFVVLLGDNFYPNGVGSTDDPQWETAFKKPYETVNVPFYAVLGNH